MVRVRNNTVTMQAVKEGDVMLEAKSEKEI